MSYTRGVQRERATRRGPGAAVTLCAALLATTAGVREARATPYRLTPADRAEVASMLRAFFEATRDGNSEAARRVVLSREEFRRVFPAGADAMIVTHQQHIERDMRELRARFAGGEWVGLTPESSAATSYELTPCGRFANPSSQCTDGPVIEWRAQGAVRRMRIDRMARIDGHWKLFDPRM